jgi:NAD+ dependent glucose-6-phosphate dehydrogenase
MVEKDRTSEKLHERRIMITGALGRVGKVLAGGLKDCCELVQVDINTGEGIIEADISSKESLEQMFDKVGAVDYIIHLAGVADHDAAWETVLKNNIVGITNIYEYARKHQVIRVILASSTHIIGLYPEYPDKPSGTPIPVDAERRPDGYYGISKAFGEDIARYYYDHFGIETIIIRIGAIGYDNLNTSPYRFLELHAADAVQIFRLALETDIPFGIFYAISGESPVFDMGPTRDKLGFTHSNT